MTTQAQKNARNKYNKKTYKYITIAFSYIDDSIIIDYLENVKSKSETIKKALYDYINNRSNNQ